MNPNGKMTHPEEAALYASVLASPHDDTVRLVMADWYDEHEQPERAELIRVGVELARTEEPQYRDVKTIGYLTPQPSRGKPSSPHMAVINAP